MSIEGSVGLILDKPCPLTHCWKIRGWRKITEKLHALSEQGPGDFPPLSSCFQRLSSTFLHFPPLSSTFLHFRLRKVFFRSTHRQKRLASLFIRSENRGINTRYFYDAKLVPHVIFSERFSKRLSPTFLHFPPLSSTFLLDFSPFKWRKVSWSFSLRETHELHTNFGNPWIFLAACSNGSV